MLKSTTKNVRDSQKEHLLEIRRIERKIEILALKLKDLKSRKQTK